MEICGLDMKEAYELYIDSGYNFEVLLSTSRLQSTNNLIQSLHQQATRSILPHSFPMHLTSTS